MTLKVPWLPKCHEVKRPVKLTYQAKKSISYLVVLHVTRLPKWMLLLFDPVAVIRPADRYRLNQPLPQLSRQVIQNVVLEYFALPKRGPDDFVEGDPGDSWISILILKWSRVNIKLKVTKVQKKIKKVLDWDKSTMRLLRVSQFLILINYRTKPK